MNRLKVHSLNFFISYLNTNVCLCPKKLQKCCRVTSRCYCVFLYRNHTCRNAENICLNNWRLILWLVTSREYKVKLKALWRPPLMLTSMNSAVYKTDGWITYLTYLHEYPAALSWIKKSKIQSVGTVWVSLHMGAISLWLNHGVQIEGFSL